MKKGTAERLKVLLDPYLDDKDEEVLLAYAKASLLSHALRDEANLDRDDPKSHLFWNERASLLATCSVMKDRHYRNSTLWHFRKAMKDLRFEMK